MFWSSGKRSVLKNRRNKNQIFFSDGGNRAKNVAGVAEMSLTRGADGVVLSLKCRQDVADGGVQAGAILSLKCRQDVAEMSLTG